MYIYFLFFLYLVEAASWSGLHGAGHSVAAWLVGGAGALGGHNKALDIEMFTVYFYYSSTYVVHPIS